MQTSRIEGRGGKGRIVEEDRKRGLRGGRQEGARKRKVRGTYRVLLVGLGGFDLLVEAVDLVLEVLQVLLVFLLLLQQIFGTPLVLLVDLHVF